MNDCGRAHHWKIDEAGGGPNSLGICVNCGATKPFGNSQEAAEVLALGASRTYREMNSINTFPKPTRRGRRPGTLWT